MQTPARPSLRRTDPASLLEEVDARRMHLSRKLDPLKRAPLGQFMTPAVIARLMAGMFDSRPPSRVRLLDPGAGLGVLTAAYVAEMCARPIRPESIEVCAYEVDTDLVYELQSTLVACRAAAEEAGVVMTFRVIETDFIAESVARLLGGENWERSG